MGQISIRVTRKVHEQDSTAELHQRQIAFRAASPELDSSLRLASKQNRLAIQLGGFMTLAVGDTGAIWRTHQQGDQLHWFDALFALLRHRVDVDMDCLCELIPKS